MAAEPVVAAMHNDVSRNTDSKNTIKYPCNSPRNCGESFSFVIPNADIVTGWTEGRPRDVEPAGAGEELVGMFTCLEERDEALELPRVLGANVGSLTVQVLGVLDAAHEGVDTAVAEAGVDDDGAADGFAGGLQQLAAAIGHVGYVLDGWDVLRVLLPIAELRQGKMITESCVFH